MPHRAQRPPSLCQRCGDVHAIFGALPQLPTSFPPPAGKPRHRGLEISTRRGEDARALSQNHNAAQADGGSSGGGGWAKEEEEVRLCQHLCERIYQQEYGHPAYRYVDV